jgi:hypothetical protein
MTSSAALDYPARMPARRPNPRPRRQPRKDRLIQTRVPRQLEETLKLEARRRRVSVSHLIRNIVEDTFRLVDGVVSDSVTLARNVRRSARRLASAGSAGAGRPRWERALSDVYAWSEVVLQRPAACSGCGAQIARGERGYTGLSDDADAPRAWLCHACIEKLPTS